MKTSRYVATLCLLLASLAHAAGSSVVIALRHESDAAAARVQVPADYVAVPITLHNDSRDPVERAQRLQQAWQLVAQRIRQQPGLALQPGRVSLSARESGAPKSFGSSSMSASTALTLPSVGSWNAGSSAQLYVLGALAPNADVFSVTQAIYRFVQGLTLGDGTTAQIGQAALGLNDPEQYRPRILAAVARLITETRQALGLALSVEINGLENPVSVLQVNDREVVLSIPYSLRIQAKAS